VRPRRPKVANGEEKPGQDHQRRDDQHAARETPVTRAPRHGQREHQSCSIELVPDREAQEHTGESFTPVLSGQHRGQTQADAQWQREPGQCLGPPRNIGGQDERNQESRQRSGKP
jgi:hypothetical protein